LNILSKDFVLLEMFVSKKVLSTNAEQVISQRKTSKYATYVFVVLFIINFLNYMDRYVLIGAANVIARELDFGIDGVGYLSSAFIVLFALSAIPLGVWADRVKRKNVVAICLIIWSMATAFTALARNFLQLLILRMLLGIGEAGYAPASSAMLANYFSRDKRARILSWWSTAVFGGLMIGTIIGGGVAGIGFGTWRWAFVFTGIPGLLLAILVWRLREPRRNEADNQAALQTPGPIPSEKFMKRLRRLLRIKSLWVATAMQLFAFFVLGAGGTYLPIFLQQNDTFGLSSAAAGAYMGIGTAVVGIVGTLIGGYWADALNRRYPGARVIVSGIGFLIASPCNLISSVIALTSHNFLLFSCFFLISILLVTMYSGPLIAAMQDVVPSYVHALAVAIGTCIAHLLGDAVSPSLVGILARALDPTHGQHFVQKLAGHDLGIVFAYVSPIALAIAGLIGLIGARWVRTDMAAAELAEQQP
jgi:MFS transporter, Spinster family, sphingosine-1-phosphate transporter